MEDQTNPLPVTVARSGETPSNAANVERALRVRDEPALLVTEDEHEEKTAIVELGNDGAWITIGNADLIDCGEWQ